VLFVGNSYTQANDLPSVFMGLAGAAGIGVTVDAWTVGGATVSDHAQSADVALLLQAGWDFVVIQGQSVEPIVQPAVFAAAIDGLSTSISATTAQPVMFETWARAASSPVLGQLGLTAEQMQDALHSAYDDAATRNGGTLAPVGQGWHVHLDAHPSVALHSADGSHPNLAGTYLSACVFLGTLTATPCTGNAFVPAGLDETLVDDLQAAADAI